MYFILLLTIPVLTAETTEKKEEKKINIDKKHLETDFFDLFGMITDIFSDKDMDLQYFATHDLDGNKNLDGLELFKALVHEYEHEEEGKPVTYTEKDIATEVDEILSEYDMDNDGFLDYTEFERIQKVHEETNTVNQVKQ